MMPDAEVYIVLQNVANVYMEPDTSSPLATQAIFGAAVSAGDAENGFRRVSLEDRYEGWLDGRLLAPPQDTSDFLATTTATLFAEVYSAADVHSEMLTKLVVGTNVVVARRPEIGDWVPILVRNEEIGYIHRVCLNVTHSSVSENLYQVQNSNLPRKTIITAIGSQAAATAKRLIGTPYLWGGCTPFGIDCSGLTQFAYKLNGIQLLRDAHLQFADKRFERVEEGHGLEAALLDDGDLVVFSRRDDKRATHIGLALGDGRFIHARGGQTVRIDSCDTSEYAETYLGAIRLSANADFAVEAA